MSRSLKTYQVVLTPRFSENRRQGIALLRWESHHPPTLKWGIPKGQYIRARRNCSNFASFKTELDTLYRRFRERGYPHKTLTNAFQHASSQNRSSLLNNKKTEVDGTNTMRIIGTYDIVAPQVRDIINTFWPILKRDPIVSDLIMDKPSIVYRRGRNIGDFVVHSHYTPPPQEGTWLTRQVLGTYRCGGCKACQYIWKTKTTYNHRTGIEYQSRYFANCKTPGVVYLARCDCPLFYVGKTTRELRRRILEHIGDIQHSRDTPITQHMRSVHQKAPFTISFWALEVIKADIRGGIWIASYYKNRQRGSLGSRRLLRPDSMTFVLCPLYIT